MNALKKGERELLPLDRSEVPADVLALVEEKGAIADMKRFRARNWRKGPSTGMAFSIDGGAVLLIQEECQLLIGRGCMVPAWGITVTHPAGENPMLTAVDGMYCHAEMKVGSFSYNVSKS